MPITCSEEPGVEDWYAANVVGDLGVFLIVVNSYDAFAGAFRHKLTLEIAGRAPSRKLAHLTP